MKAKFMKMGGLMIVMALLGIVSMQSCSKTCGEGEDESTGTPTDVTNPLTESVYYVTGVVTSGGSAVEDVTVTTGSVTATTDSDGTYSLTLSSTANTSVSFSKDGYVTVASTVIFESSASSGATVILSQEMTQLVETQEVVAGEAIVLDFTQPVVSEESSATVVTVTVPAEAVTENVSISATVFVPAQEESVAEAITTVFEELEDDSKDEVEVAIASTFVALDLQPDGTTFDVPITVSIPVESTSTYFTNVDHVKYNETTGAWEYEGEAVFNNGAYDISLSGFSQHGVQTESNITVSKSSKTIASQDYDNIGALTSMTSTLTYNQLSGWEIASGDSTNELYNEMVSYIVNFMGTLEGESTISTSRDVAVSGDEKLSVTVSQSVVTYLFNFDTNNGVETISVDSYGSVSIATETEQGDLRTDHNY